MIKFESFLMVSVFPEPGHATIRRCPLLCVIASACSGSNLMSVFFIIVPIVYYRFFNHLDNQAMSMPYVSQRILLYLLFQKHEDQIF